MTIAPEILYVIGIVILGLVIAGVLVYVRGRNKANDAVTEAATHELHKHPETYDEQAKPALESEIRR